MSRNFTTTYNIRSKNTHLLNILDSEYYIEVGTIPFQVIDDLLQGGVKKLTDLFDEKILIDGVGQLYNQDNKEVNYQINYLYEFFAHNSSIKIVITCGTIRYLDEIETEKYAPIILLPITIDLKDNLVYMSAAPSFNVVFKKYAENNNILNQNALIYLNSLMDYKIQRVDDIDNICLKLINDFNLVVSTSNFLTKMEIEYSDLVIPNNAFDHQGSINEYNDISLLRQFFTNCKAITPTNIEQKHLIYTAHLGKSFGVDGRVGTGKTLTILNIIADLVANGKKVLYLNHDIVNINCLRKDLYRLGLYNLVCEINNSHHLKFAGDIELLTKKPDFDFKTIDSLASEEAIFDYKYHGYPYSYIIEKLTCMKQKGDDNIIDASSKLEIEEVEFIYKSLKEIEYEFSFVDPFTSNYWSTLLSSPTAPKVNEIIERTANYYAVNEKLVSILNDFCKEVGLNKIVDIADFNHLTEQLLSFERVKPISCWIDNGFKEKSNEYLDILSKEIDLNYNSLEWYKENACEDYVAGSSEKDLKVICHGHYKLNDEDSEDNKYVDLLLSSNPTFDNLVKQINTWIESSSMTYDKAKQYFKFSEPNKEQFIFMDKLIDLFEKYNIDESWLNLYAISPLGMVKKYKELNNKILEADELLKNINQYYDIEDADIEELANILSTNNYLKILKKRIDKKNLRKDKKDLKDLMEDIRLYNKYSKEIVELLPTNLHLRKLNEYVLKNYLGFLKFISSISSYESLCLSTFINEIDEQNRLKNMLNVCKTIHSLKEEGKQILGKLAIYNLTFEDNHFIGIVRNIKSSVPYFERVIQSRNNLISYFKNKSVINTFDVKLIIEVDKTYLENLKEFENNSRTFKELFGSSFKEFDTNVVEIGQTVAHFLKFMKRMSGKIDILKLINEEKLFTKLISHNQEFTDLYDEWYNALRAFSTCFYGGKMDIQNYSFVDVDKTLNEYVKRYDQVSHVFKIEHILDSFYKYKLDDLAKKIQDGVYQTNLAENYLYSTMLLFYNELKEKNFSGINVNRLESDIHFYLESEENYCNNNLVDLRNYCNDMARKAKKKKEPFFDFNNFDTYLKELPKYKKIFLTDIDTLNNLSDLSYFDTIIVDDAHLATANKYAQIFRQNNENQQFLVFGDQYFESSVTNTFIQRIDDSHLIHIKKRYLSLSQEAQNQFTKDNQYIYDTDSRISIEKYNTLKDMVEQAVMNFETNNSQINILVFNEIDKRLIYKSLIEIIRLSYSGEQTMEILDNHINLIMVGSEATRNCDDLYVWYPALIDLKEDEKKRYIRNYFNAKKMIHLSYKNTKSPQVNEKYETDIANYITNVTPLQPYIEGSVITYVFDALLNAGLSPKLGPGLIDIVIRTPHDRFGIIILGKRKNKHYSLTDDYIYYVNIYKKMGWKVLVYSMEDLYNSFNDIILEIKNIVDEEEKIGSTY